MNDGLVDLGLGNKSGGRGGAFGCCFAQNMDTARAVLILSLVWILVGSSIGVLEPPEWVQNVLVFAVIAAMR